MIDSTPSVTTHAHEGAGHKRLQMNSWNRLHPNDAYNTRCQSQSVRQAGNRIGAPNSGNRQPDRPHGQAKAPAMEQVPEIYEDQSEPASKAHSRRHPRFLWDAYGLAPAPSLHISQRGHPSGSRF